jgi:C4-dicarboxylate-specific signal transduction histidine kinase
MKTLGEMSAGIAHEINNPLAIIKGRIDIILEMITSKNLTLDEIPDRLKSIDKTVDRIAKIIDGLRSFARDSSQDPMTNTSLKLLLEDSASLCQARFKISEVILEMPSVDEEITISCRASQIAQVLVNLLSNAFDAVKDLPEKWIKVSVDVQEEYIEINITDSGPGIAEELRDKILQPFFTTKEIGKGTGLGLSISLGILKAHGGELDLDKDCSHTRFVIKLPRLHS